MWHVIFTETNILCFLSLLRNAPLSNPALIIYFLINALYDHHRNSKHTKVCKMKLKAKPLPLSLRFQSARWKPKYQQMILFSFENNHKKIFQLLSSLLQLFLEHLYIYIHIYIWWSILDEQALSFIFQISSFHPNCLETEQIFLLPLIKNDISYSEVLFLPANTPIRFLIS